MLGLGGNFNTSLFARLANDTWVLPSPGIRNRFPNANDPNGWYVQAFASVDLDGDGPLPPELWIGGAFSHANGVPAANWTRWRLASMPPVITQEPVAAQACLNGSGALTVVASGPGALTYSWRVGAAANVPAGWTVLADGPLVVNGQQVATVTGAATGTLLVQCSGTPFAADFRCTIGNTCGSIETVTAHLAAAPCCGSADFNHDGDSATDADIEAFFACLAGDCCATCDTADFNGDGDSGTDADIESFFRVLAGGPC